MIKKILFLLFLFIIKFSTIQAQVDDVNFIISPQVGLIFPDKNTTVSNKSVLGFQSGFGFGKIFELRGEYLKSSFSDQNFSKYQSVINNDPTISFNGHPVSLTRIGGLFKANVQIGKMSPNIQFGLGSQTFKIHDINGLNQKLESLYTSAGLGLKLNITPRIIFDISGRALAYNFNPNEMFFDAANSSSTNNWIQTLSNKRMLNWEINSGVSFYLGGTNTDKLSVEERAYLNKFRDRLDGFRLTLSPVYSAAKFDSKSLYRNTQLFGGILGMFFSDFTGVQAYYLQSMTANGTSVKFDKLAMYGLDFVGKLNIPHGILPYVTIGVGNIHTPVSYNGELITTGGTATVSHPKSSYYAKGGLGAEIPLGTNVMLFGSANLLFSNKNNQIGSITTTNQIQSHQLYAVGMRLRLGKKSKVYSKTDNLTKSSDYSKALYQKKLDSLSTRITEAFRNNNLDKVKLLMNEKSNLDIQFAAVTGAMTTAKYTKQADSLEKALVKAYQTNNQQEVLKIMSQKHTLDMQRYNLDKAKPTDSLIRITPNELQNLIEKTIDKVVLENETNTILIQLDKVEEKLNNLIEKQNQPKTNFNTNATTSHSSTTSTLNSKTEAAPIKNNIKKEEAIESKESKKSTVLPSSGKTVLKKTTTKSLERDTTKTNK